MQDKSSWRLRADDINRCLLKAVAGYQSLRQEAETEEDRAALQQELRQSVTRINDEMPADPDLSSLAERLLRAIVESTSRSPLNGTGLSLQQQAIRIDHVAIAVRDLEAAIKFYSERYGFRQTDRRTIQGTDSSMDSAVMQAGDVTFVLVMGLDEKSNVSRYIEHYGPGVQHVAVQVHGLKDVMDNLTASKADLLTDIIRAPGLRQAFTRRDKNSGMQFEFIERGASNEFDENNVKQLYDAMDREDVY